MKKIFLNISALLFISISSYSQSKQKQMLKQIAALQIYIGYAKKGYDIASKGINTVRNIKKGEFTLHQDFFNSLKNVNPEISKYVKIADIISIQVHIIKQAKQTLQGIKEAKQFTAEELDYCKTVFDNLLDECVKTIDELFLVITSGKLEMKDDERIKRINKIFTDMQDKYSFCSAFSEETGLLSMQRMSEEVQLNYSKLINGLK
ncbi:MAG: hypothetical protein KF825_06745 [Ferruginibacter sp.]|nr:hypothetical protein [Ferruginibacter sp.]